MKNKNMFFSILNIFYTSVYIDLYILVIRIMTQK